MPGNLTKRERQDTVPVRLQARTGGPRLGVQQRLIPVSARFFAEVSAYLKAERPAGPGTDIVFVVLKGPRRGMPLSAKGLDEILDGARGRAGLAPGDLPSAAAYLPDPAVSERSCSGCIIQQIL